MEKLQNSDNTYYKLSDRVYDSPINEKNILGKFQK